MIIYNTFFLKIYKKFTIVFKILKKKSKKNQIYLFNELKINIMTKSLASLISLKS